jgi:dihydrofolate reductase
MTACGGRSEENMVRDASTVNGKVVVNRAMSLDGFIAGPGDAMGWIFDHLGGGIEEQFPEIMAATGAMLVGRRTYEVAKRMASEPGQEPGYDGGPEFVLTHEPPDPPDPTVTFLTGDIGAAVTTARSAAGGKNLEIIGADVAGQCLRRGLVDEILVYLLPVLLGDGIRFFSSPGLARIDLEPISVTPAGPVTLLRFRVRK